MEREILFRGNRLDNGEWIEGYAAQSGGTFIICDNGLTYGGFEVFEVEPATVGQYTDLTDKNGQKIFEGDIVCVMVSIKGSVYFQKVAGVIEWYLELLMLIWLIWERDIFYILSERLKSPATSTTILIFWRCRNETD